MASAKRGLIILITIMLATLFGVSVAAIHNVVFEYNNSTDDVRQVSLEDFESCDGTSAIAAYTSGSDMVALDKAGHYYFISGVAGHCKAGQKLDLLVQSGLFERIAVFFFPFMDMGPAKFCLAMATLFGVSLAAIHKVGDSTGWNVRENTDFGKWASNNTFIVGDYLLFEYNNSTHDVRKVSLDDFESCNGTSAIAAYTSGSDTVALHIAGRHYFISGVAGHCQAGLKVNVLVHPAASPRKTLSREDCGLNLIEAFAVHFFPNTDIGEAKIYVYMMMILIYIMLLRVASV
ncbi:Plastocyanin-like protein [Corchorus capsularis]|uniref:Plastocyanin-like protein n=1 Tax=Corchorus capsularis TaxID=210143 RepID=A0A1R3IQG6_COCAP|nr:Plastocyanin-like protein [Corchorus capsularis]